MLTERKTNKYIKNSTKDRMIHLIIAVKRPRNNNNEIISMMKLLD